MNADNPVAKTARNLTEIEHLYALLPTQAVHKANDRLMPGGHATVASAPISSLDDWNETLEAAEHRHATNPFRWAEPVHEDDDREWQPPLQRLVYWSERWRKAHGYPIKSTPTLSSEVGFLRWALEWACENEPLWEKFAKDVTGARTNLENLLYAGNRAERSRVTCVWADCEKKPRLIRVYGESRDFDGHKCPNCKRRYTHAEFVRAFQIQLHDENSEGRWVLLADALVTLRDQGRGENTIRSWIKRGDVETCRDKGKTFVWWPDLWDLHRTAPTRGRMGA